MSIEKEFIPFEEALALKELGFDETCLAGYDKETEKLWIGYVDSQGGEQFNRSYHVLAPLYQQAFNFFLKKYNLFVETTLWGDEIGYMSQIKEIKQEEFIEVYSLGIATPNRGLPNWDIVKEKQQCLSRLIEIAQDKVPSKN